MQSLTNVGNGSQTSQGVRILPHELVGIPISAGMSTGQHHHSFYSNNSDIFREQSTATINQQYPHLITDNSSVSFMNQSDHPSSWTDNNVVQVKMEDDAIESSIEKSVIQQMDDDDQEPEPEIDILINNVVSSFSVRCHLNLREIALNGVNVEYRRENGTITMKLRRPYTTALMWSSGKITCTGATSEEQARVAARRYARCLQKMGFGVKFHNFRVVNVLGTCNMPWAIKITNFSQKHKNQVSYEPELNPGVTYKLKFPKATLKIFSTGSITITAVSVANVQAAIEHIFPLVYEFRNERPTALPKKKPINDTMKQTRTLFGHASNDPLDDNMYVSESNDTDDDDDE